MISTQCIKVAELRKKYGNNIDLQQWMANPNNLYVGRPGRIFINGEIFHYAGSKWANPYKLTEYSIDESLELYKAHLKNKNLLAQLGELLGKTLGCFCDQNGKCHAKVLAELCNNAFAGLAL